MVFPPNVPMTRDSVGSMTLKSVASPDLAALLELSSNRGQEPPIQIGP